MPTRRLGFLLFTVYYALLTPLLAVAAEYSSASYGISAPVINELGGFATSSNFQLWGSIPYIEPLRSTSTHYINNPDFLGFSGTNTTTSTTTSTGGSGGTDGAPPVKPRPEGKPSRSVDFNRDGFVNFIDFSILLYYFDKTGERITPYDLNDDGVVDVVDISIFMYYWDGN